MAREGAGGRRAFAALLVSGATALGCGLAGEEAELTLPAEPLPVVIPPAMVGQWVAATRLGERDVLAWPCAGVPLTVGLAQGGPVSVGGGEAGAGFQAALTMAELQSDGSVLLSTDRGALRLTDRDEGQVWAQGSLPGFEQGRLLANPASSAVEQIFPVARACGVGLSLEPLSWLSAGRYNQAGDACVAAGLTLDLSPRQPSVTRANLRLGIEAVSPGEGGGTWLTLSDPAGGLQGLRLVPAEGGAVQVWQRLDAGMAFETLRPASGLCMGAPEPVGADPRRQKPPRQGPDRRLPR